MTLHWKFYNKDMKTGEKIGERTEIYLNNSLIIVQNIVKNSKIPLDVRKRKTKRVVEVLESFVGTLIHFYVNDEFKNVDELLKVNYVEKKLTDEYLINFSIEIPGSYAGPVEPSDEMNEYLRRNHITLTEFRKENTKSGFWRPYHDKYGNPLNISDNIN